MVAGEPVRGGTAVACTAEQTQLGEGVRWDGRRSELLRVDIMARRVYRDRVADGGGLVPVRSYQVPGTVGAVAPVRGDDGWVLAAGRGFVHLTTDGDVHPLAVVAARVVVVSIVARRVKTLVALQKQPRRLAMRPRRPR
jgi:sugar lactone lactonase YvrE